MSAHVICAGISGQQSWQYVAGEHRNRSGGLKNLVDVWNFWSKEPFPEVLNRNATRGTCSIETKEIRDIFYKGSLKEINAKLPELMTYGFEDVKKTLEIFRTLYKAWLVTLPSTESQYFYLKRAKVNYSISDDFTDWFYNCENIYLETLAKVELQVKEVVDEIVAEYKAAIDKALLSIPETLPQDFYTKTSKYTKLQSKYSNKYILAQDLGLLSNIQNYRAESFPELNWKTTKDGKPFWSETELTSKSPNFQLLLKPKFRGETVSYSRKLGFYSIDSSGNQLKVTSPKKGINTKDNCGSLFSKDFIEYWENGTLEVDSNLGKQIVTLMATISYWISVRSRLAELVQLYCDGDHIN
jgi:hypothetical protein